MAKIIILADLGKSPKKLTPAYCRGDIKISEKVIKYLEAKRNHLK